jgi:hypothetical protein
MKEVNLLLVVGSGKIGLLLRLRTGWALAWIFVFYVGKGTSLQKQPKKWPSTEGRIGQKSVFLLQQRLSSFSLQPAT